MSRIPPIEPIIPTYSGDEHRPKQPQAKTVQPPKAQTPVAVGAQGAMLPQPTVDQVLRYSLLQNGVDTPQASTHTTSGAAAITSLALREYGRASNDGKPKSR